MLDRIPKRLGYLIATGLIAAACAVTNPFFEHLDFIFGAMLILLIVLFLSIRFGMGPAILASFLGSMYLNYYFVEPIFDIDLRAGPDKSALPAFLITAIVVGRLSQNAQQRAIEAEKGKLEIERLYGELKVAFERTSYLEALKRSEQMKSALLDAVTHDLRTPLTAIKAASTTLYNSGKAQSGLSAENRRELLEVVIEESDRLNNFVEELLVFARIQGGSIDTIETPGSIEDVVSAATQRATANLKEHRLSIETGGPETHVANPRIAAQALYALLDNAAKYSPRGSRVTITVASNGDKATFMVDDEGPGIPPEDREIVFSRFYRRPHASSPASPGLGMGLAIARGLIEAVGGDIKIVDREGPGTRFQFSIPLSKNVVEQDEHVEIADQNPRR